MIAAILLTISTVHASTTDSHSLPLYSLDKEEDFFLQTMQTRTMYREETVDSTCYRKEFTGYINICNYYPQMVCPTYGGYGRYGGYGGYSGGGCYSVPDYRCTPQPQYTSIAYTCYQTVSIPYEVNDHQVLANIHINVKKNPKVSTDQNQGSIDQQNQETIDQNQGSVDSNGENCLLDYLMEGESLTATTDCQSLIVLSNQTMNYEGNINQSRTVTQNYNVQLKLLDMKTVLAPVSAGITDMHIVGHTLMFRTGNLSKNPNFEINFYAERKHLLKKDIVLFNRNLSINEYSFQKINDNSGIVKIDLNQTIGDFNNKKKHFFTVDIEVNLESGKVLNTNIPSLRTSSSLTVDN